MKTATQITRIADKKFLAEGRRSSNGQGRFRNLGVWPTKTQATMVANAYAATGARP